MQSEYDSLMKYETWELVSRPKFKKVLSNRWVFKIKRKQDSSIDKYKARLVVRGCEQKQGMDYEEIFAPVARYETIRAFLAGCVQEEMYVHQMDVVTAYIQGDLSDEIYMEQPEAFEVQGQESKVCKLKRPFYGLKQAGRCWYAKLDTYLKSIDMINNDIDPCVYVSTNKNDKVIIVVYVDDILLASKSIYKLHKLKENLGYKFQMNDLGSINDILGISVERNEPTGKIKLNQKRYIIDILQKFKMENCKPISTPLEPNQKLTKELQLNLENRKEDMKHKPYRELIGSLIYLANATRPDLAFAASALSRFCIDPDETHWKLAKRVLRYLQNTIDYSITYTKNYKEMQAYVDSDWAGDVEDRKSCSGNVIILANGPISWESKKQKSVALSTMEAEYIALSEVCKEVVYLRRLLEHMGFESSVRNATEVYCDNQSAIELNKNHVFHGRSKHVDIRYHYSREARKKGLINVNYLSTDKMIADLLTKSLPKAKHEECVRLLKLNYC